jgi:hypothetical protein
MNLRNESPIDAVATLIQIGKTSGEPARTTAEKVIAILDEGSFSDAKMELAIESLSERE